jgi:hypothetical protein
MNGSLFVAHENELHFGFDRFQRVKNGDGGSAGVAENELNAEIVEGFDESLCSVE